MRTASMILGIIGGTLTMLWGLINVLITGVLLSELFPTAVTVLLGTVLGILGAGVPGLVGGIIVKRKNVAAGVLMIVSAALSIFAYFNFISIILFVLGAIFALIKEQPVNPYPAYFQPPYPYYQYPQYPQYPQQPYPPQQPVPPTENLSEPPQQQ